MMKKSNWRMYPPLINVLNDRCEPKLTHEFRTSDETMWITQEKVEGARVTYYFNRSTYKFCISSPSHDIDFGNLYNIIRRKLTPYFKSKFDLLWDSLGAKEYVALHGALIGGKYPHPDVVPAPAMRKILLLNKKIFYSPLNYFYAFDLEVDGRYPNPLDAMAIFESLRLAHAPIRLKGTYDECVGSPHEFDSEIPLQLGYPAIENNLAAGIVIKPVNNIYNDNGQRILLKKECL